MAAINANLVLGAAIGYDDDKMRPFLHSLEAAGFAGKVVLYVSRDGVEHDGLGLDISFLPVPYFDQALAAMSPTAQRFFVFRHFLANHQVSGSVLISDIRDVLFQADPFLTTKLARFDLLYALEERVIGECPSNTTWINSRYGQGVLRRLSGNLISCCGTVLGTYAGMRAYLDKMCQHLLGASTMFGIDQGVHNYIVHLDPVNNQCGLLNGLGPIMTMHYMNKEHLLLSDDDKLLNYDGSVPNIVHQYDRLPQPLQARLAGLVRARHVPAGA